MQDIKNEFKIVYVSFYYKSAEISTVTNQSSTSFKFHHTTVR